MNPRDLALQRKLIAPQLTQRCILRTDPTDEGVGATVWTESAQLKCRLTGVRRSPDKTDADTALPPHLDVIWLRYDAPLPRTGDQVRLLDNPTRLFKVVDVANRGDADRVLLELHVTEIFE